MPDGIFGNTIAISGSTGFLGRKVIDELGSTNRIIALTREDFGKDGGKLAKKIGEAEIIVNLAGAPIIRRWTRTNRNVIYESRIGTTGVIVDCLRKIGRKGIRFLSVSAIGIYDFVGRHTESSGAYTEGFMKKLVTDWEKAAMAAGKYCESVSILRLGVVLGENGGILKRVLPLFRMGLGARIGKGEQVLSYVHIDDVVGSMVHLLEAGRNGIFNTVSPNPVTNREFTRCLASLVNKPAVLVIPVFMLKMLLGEGASAILNGPYVIPEKLVESGYNFKFEKLEHALYDIIKR